MTLDPKDVSNFCFLSYHEEQRVAAFTVEITGADRDQLARELSEHLTAHQGQVQIYAETERVAIATTVVSAVLAGIQAADIIWKWWQNRQKSGANVTIRTASGRVIVLANVDQHHIELVLEEED